MKLYDFLASIRQSTYDFIIDIPAINETFKYIPNIDYFGLENLFEKLGISKDLHFLSFCIENDKTQTGKPVYHLYFKV